MNKKIMIILSFGILTILSVEFVLAITGISPSVIYPGDTINLIISPNKKFGF